MNDIDKVDTSDDYNENKSDKNNKNDIINDTNTPFAFWQQQQYIKTQQ